MSTNPKTAAEIADQIADDTHRLVYATMPSASVDIPADAYDVIGWLNVAATRYPQLLRQIKDRTADAYSTGRIGADDGDPIRHCGEIVNSLTDAARHAEQLHIALSRAHAALSHLTQTDNQTETAPQTEPPAHPARLSGPRYPGER